jgi:CheY-like chemotaxis protein
VSRSATTSSVLLVDDEDLFRMSLSVVLSARIPALRVLEARDGAAALAVLRDERVDCVVSDLVMPGMQGTTFLAELITRRIRVPVIVVSAYALAAPPIDDALICLPKPVDLDQVCATVARMLTDRAPPAGEVTLMGLFHVLACRLASCTVEVVSTGGGGARKGIITLKGGRVTQAHASIEHGVALTRVGLDAAADILGWDAPEVSLSEDPAGATHAEAQVDEPLVAVFAYAIARRRAATARRF